MCTNTEALGMPDWPANGGVFHQDPVAAQQLLYAHSNARYSLPTVQRPGLTPRSGPKQESQAKLFYKSPTLSPAVFCAKILFV